MKTRASTIETANRLVREARERVHLGAHREEWAVLDALCRIPVSRFYP